MTALKTLLAACAATSLATAFPAYAEEWDLLVYNGINDPATKLMIEFAEDVKAKTEGRIEITVRAPGELPYGPVDYHRVVGRGDVAMADTAYISSDVPATGALTSAFLVQNHDELRKAMPAVAPLIDEKLKPFGAEVLFWWAYPPIKFWGVGEPPKTAKDLAGLKTRSISAEHQELLKMVGAVPVAVAAPEVMTALQYGTVNAALTTAIAVVATKWEDVMDWGYELELSPTPSYVIINSATLAALDEKDRNAVKEAGAVTQEKLLALVMEREVKDTAGLRERGMVINAPTAEERATLQQQAVALWEAWAKSHDNGEAIITAIRGAVGR
ncbi:MAG: TRAP transporter substrate-binding protein DctP [Rhizobiaceae bacterium]|nr:TRAP transporter substrate-binding protein DctP [Rhizobiaceae bacterium]